MLAPDVGGTAFRPTSAPSPRRRESLLNLRLELIARRGNRVVGVFYDEYGRRRVEKDADMIVVEHGSVPVDDLYFELKADSRQPRRGRLRCAHHRAPADHAQQSRRRLPPVPDRRRGASRNIHAAIYDAIRLMKDI